MLLYESWIAWKASIAGGVGKVDRQLLEVAKYPGVDQFDEVLLRHPDPLNAVSTVVEI